MYETKNELNIFHFIPFFKFLALNAYRICDNCSGDTSNKIFHI